MTIRAGRRLAVQYGDERLEFEVVPSPSRVSSVRISIDSLTGIQVLAPMDASDAAIRAAVRRRARWICRHREPAGDGATRKRAISGEELLYLGRRYLLKVADGADESVKLKGGRLIVLTRRRDPDAVRAAVDGWYRQRAKAYFSRRIEALFSSTLDARASPPEFSIRAMRRQWGSCSPAGKILLNPLLIRAPRSCVDYVVAHELCHLRHHDHGPGFYRLLETRMPDWQERKSLLELVAVQIL